MTFPWTKQQEDILGSTDRVTIVQAGPGSGKTKVFAEFVDRRLRTWQQRGGLAALSFTNVARDEIVTRLSSAAVPPHFIGTLDAFFLRFVLAPFGFLAGLPKSGLRLIPSPLDEQMTTPTARLAGDRYVPLFRTSAVGGTEAKPSFMLTKANGRTEHLGADDSSIILNDKNRLWSKTGRVSHGDCSYLAARLLVGPHGKAIRKLLARRFPVICIDEFQDTGHFLGRAALALLATQPIESLIVGDVDQKIFGFSGVNPDLFSIAEKLKGAKPYPLRISQRCPTRVCTVATLLARSGQQVTPREGAPTGTLIIEEHADKLGRIELSRFLAVLKAAPIDCKDAAILVRTRAEKGRIQRAVQTALPPLRARGPSRMNQAIQFLRDGNARKALDVTESLAFRILLDDDRPTPEVLDSSQIDRRRLRRKAARLLLSVVHSENSETWRTWSGRVKNEFFELATLFGAKDFSRRLGAAFQIKQEENADGIRVTNGVRTVWPDSMLVGVFTVHEAKGREFDAVLYYSSKPHTVDGQPTCPSRAWWAPSAYSEEREVAYVAVTRSKTMLALMVHSETMEALRRNRRAFVDAFASGVGADAQPDTQV